MTLVIFPPLLMQTEVHPTNKLDAVDGAGWDYGCRIALACNG